MEELLLDMCYDIIRTKTVAFTEVLQTLMLGIYGSRPRLCLVFLFELREEGYD